MADQPNKELQDLFIAVTKLREYLASDSKGIALVDDALNKLCRHYNSVPVAREGRYLIQNILGLHPHLHCTETPVEDWGFEVVVSCDNCGQKETHRVVRPAVDIATANMLGKHEACKPKPRIPDIEHFPHLVN